MVSCSVGELSWWRVVLVGTCPGRELSWMGIRPGWDLSRWGIVLVGSGPEMEFVLVGIGLDVSYLLEICPGGELSQVGISPGGELSCWEIVLVGTHLGGSCPMGRCSKHSKLLADLYNYTRSVGVKNTLENILTPLNVNFLRNDNFNF